MNIDIERYLKNSGHSFDEIAKCLNMTIINDELLPKKSITLNRFKEAIGEFIEDGIESGENPEYILSQIISDAETQNILIEMMLE
jgi:hypothetical protein